MPQTQADPTVYKQRGRGQVQALTLLDSQGRLYGLYSVTLEHGLGGWVGVRVLGDVNLEVDKYCVNLTGVR